MLDDRARGIFDQETLDVEHDIPALVLVELARLRRQEPVDLGVAILRVVSLGIARIIFHQIAVGTSAIRGTLTSEGKVMS